MDNTQPTQPTWIVVGETVDGKTIILARRADGNWGFIARYVQR
jgi:hypothetical protein